MSLNVSRRRFVLMVLSAAAVPLAQACVSSSQPTTKPAAEPTRAAEQSAGAKATAAPAAKPAGDAKLLFWNNNDQWKKTNDFYTI